MRVQEGARVEAFDNEAPWLPLTYAGLNPVRWLFSDALALDLGWRGGPPRREVREPSPDLCAVARPPQPALGAVEDIRACGAGRRADTSPP